MNTDKTMCAVKHYFAAGNTGEGFYNCFDYINDNRRKGFLYILKGGPGTGKSTLMKKIGAYFEAAGEQIEYFHCSSDVQSLDGVRLPRINVAVVDGTSPHTLDAVMPGITDSIVNLGEFIGAGIREHKGKIQKLAAQKKERFDTAYAYIRAAAALDSANQTLLAKYTDTKAVIEVVNNVLEGEVVDLEKFTLTEQGDSQCHCDNERKLFISAVANDGTVNFRTVNKYSKIISLTDNEYAARIILAALSACFLYDVIARRAKPAAAILTFCDIISPHNREAAYIAAADTLIAINVPEAATAINLKETLKPNYSAYRDSLLYGRETITAHIAFAAKTLSEVKAIHGEIESFYTPYMDFNNLNRTAKKLIDEIELSF